MVLWLQLIPWFCSKHQERISFWILIAHALLFPKVAAATENMTDFDLTKYHWRQQLGGSGSGDYLWLVKHGNKWLIGCGWLKAFMLWELPGMILDPLISACWHERFSLVSSNYLLTNSHAGPAICRIAGSIVWPAAIKGA